MSDRIAQFDAAESPGDELLELAVIHLEGRLTGRQRDRLNTLLATDAGNRDRFVALCTHASILASCVGIDEELDDSKYAASNSPPWESRTYNGAATEPTAYENLNLSPLPSSLSPPFVGEPVFSYMVASVVLCLMLLGAWAYKITQVTPVRSDFVEQRDQSAPFFVGKVTGMKDCRWGEDEPGTMIGASVPLGRKYAIASGLMEITYTSGAGVILEGPCTYKADSTVGGYLGRGKLTALVENAKPQAANPDPRTPNPEPRNSSLIPHPSSLFTVTTPTAIVTDLGTEFGVEVSEDGGTVSHVFRGSVRVRIVGGSGGEVVLRADESAQVTGGSDGGVPRFAAGGARAKLPKFITRMPLPDSERASEDYAELVLSMGPAAYYRMERSKDKKHCDNLVDSSGAGRHGSLLSDNPGVDRFVPGRWGDALRLRGPEFGDAAIMKDYPVVTNDRLTVSAWVLANRWLDAWPQIAGNWGNTERGQFHLGLFEMDYDLAVKVAQRDGELLVAREENTRFPLGLWQHVAFVADGTELRLYRNGAEVASTPCRGLQPSPVIKSLAVGCKTDDEGDAVSGKYWHGLIDELALFNRALSSEDIHRLYVGKPGPIRDELLLGGKEGK